MDDLIRQGIAIFRGMWQRRWVGLAAAWIIGIAGVVAIMRMPDVYEASARIYVDTQSVLKPLMSGLAVQPNVDQQVMILSRTLISRPNVEKLIRMADLDLTAKTKADQDAMVDALMKSLKIESLGRDNLYTLSSRDPKPERAKRVVQSLASIFVESSLGAKRKDSESAKKFIEDQIKAYEKKLEEAEDRLKNFKIRNLTTADSLEKDYFTRLSELTTQLSRSRLELREAENSRDSIKKEISGEEPVMLPDESPAMVANTAVPDIDSRLDPLKKNLDTLSQRYTDQHPDIIVVKRQIADLEKEKAEVLAARKKAAAATAKTRGGTLQGNPVYQQLRVSLAEIEATVAQLRTRVQEYESRLARLKDAAKLAPQLEAEFAQLNRDYAVHKRNYEGLVTRREQAEISSDMETLSGADFRLIDPPRVTPQPVAPNRMLLLAVALVVAIGSGLFASFAASQIWPTFFEVRSLREITQLPVLGTVTMLVGDELKRRERRGLMGFVAGVVAFLGTYGAGLLALFLLSTRAAAV